MQEIDVEKSVTISNKKSNFNTPNILTQLGLLPADAQLHKKADKKHNSKPGNLLIGALIINDRFQIIEADKKIHKLLEFESGDLIGTNILTLISPSQVHIFFNHIETSFRNKISILFKLEFTLQDTSAKIYQTECILEKDSGDHYFLILIFADVCTLYFFEGALGPEEEKRIKNNVTSKLITVDSLIEENFELFSPPFHEKTTPYTGSVSDNILNLSFHDDFKIRLILFKITEKLIKTNDYNGINISVTSIKIANQRCPIKLFFIISSNYGLIQLSNACYELDAAPQYCNQGILKTQNDDLYQPISKNIIESMNGSIWTDSSFEAEMSIYFTIELDAKA